MSAALGKEPLAQDKVISLAVECLGVGRAPFKKAVALARQEQKAQAEMAAAAEQDSKNEPKGAMVDMNLPNGVWPRQVYAAISGDTYFYAENICRECGGQFLGAGRAPLFLVEKNAASAGGSLLIRLVCCIYGLAPNPMTQIEDPKRLYEDMSARLLAGDGICYIDNARGAGLQKLPWLESLLTEPSFSCRMPYKQGQANVTRRVFALSTNGALLRNDLSTRTVKIAINKRPDDYPWFDWPEGGIEEHAQSNCGNYLAAVGDCRQLRPFGRVGGTEQVSNWQGAQTALSERRGPRFRRRTLPCEPANPGIAFGQRGCLLHHHTREN